MEENLQKGKEEIIEAKKEKTWQGKIISAKIDASQGASLFKVLAFLSAFAGIPLSYVGNSTLLILGGFVIGFLFLGISYILQAQEVIIVKLYGNSQDRGENNDNQT
jgi:hypothetical protein